MTETDYNSLRPTLIPRVLVERAKGKSRGRVLERFISKPDMEKAKKKRKKK